jgi:hypothetical protein
VPPEKPAPPVPTRITFATLLYAACDPKAPWPDAVKAWGDADVANASLLKQLKSIGVHGGFAGQPAGYRLIEEVLHEVRG